MSVCSGVPCEKLQIIELKDEFLSELDLFKQRYILPFKESINGLRLDSEELEIEEFIKKEINYDSSEKKYNEEDSFSEEDERYEITKIRLYLNNMSQSNKINLEETSSKRSFHNRLKTNENQKIFNIKKISKISKINGSSSLLGRKRGKVWRKFNIDWESIIVPKEKHFHLDRKKHRIVFQRKHLKVIYSIVDLEFPINFKKCFDKIKIHVGDKTNRNFGDKKSFHIVKINNNEEILTFKEKKNLLKNKKI